MYGVIGRLTRWTDPDGSVSYTYDKNGNVLTVTDANIAFFVWVQKRATIKDCPYEKCT
jgi:YD repeat-containing protein